MYISSALTMDLWV